MATRRDAGKTFLSQRKIYATFTELIELSNTNLFPLWSYLQLKHYLDNPAHRERFTKAPTFFESALDCPPQNSSMFGEPYASLLSDHAFWESVLDRDRRCQLGPHPLIHPQGLSTQENGYKLQTKWYKTPDLLHKCVLLVSNRCWICSKEIGTFLHIWWT